MNATDITFETPATDNQVDALWFSPEAEVLDNIVHPAVEAAREALVAQTKAIHLALLEQLTESLVGKTVIFNDHESYTYEMMDTGVNSLMSKGVVKAVTPTYDHDNALAWAVSIIRVDGRARTVDQYAIVSLVD
jgi:hypothetical protein